MIFRDVSIAFFPALTCTLDSGRDDVVGSAVHSFETARPSIIHLAPRFLSRLKFWAIDPNSKDKQDWTPWGDYHGQHPVPPSDPFRSPNANQPKPTNPPRDPHGRYDDPARPKDSIYGG